jgi:hypothetical protein
VRQRVAAVTLVAMIRGIAATARLHLDDRSGWFAQPPAPPAIFCVWHNRLALCLRAYFDYARERSAGKGLAGMVSASRDGAFLSAVLEAYHIQPVRGSTSRRGRQALLELARWARRGYNLAITPDGPRGPRYKVQQGIIALAHVTGMPIIPFSYHLDRKIELKSWDRFQIPLPLSRCDMIAGAPLHIPRDADETERERLRLELERRMMEITKD